MRIRSVKTDASTYPMHIVNAVGNTLSYRTATVFVQNLLDYDCITEREAHIILGAVNDKVLPFTSDIRDTVRARIFKSILTSLMRG